jgi:hypothetical protein
MPLRACSCPTSVFPLIRSRRILNSDNRKFPSAMFKLNIHFTKTESFSANARRSDSLVAVGKCDLAIWLRQAQARVQSRDGRKAP